MATINYSNGMELNIVGGRYVSNNTYVDVTEHYYCIGNLDNPCDFGMGTECTLEDAIKGLQN